MFSFGKEGIFMFEFETVQELKTNDEILEL